MKTSLFGITWAAVEYTALFPLLVLALFLLLYRVHRTRKVITLLAGPWSKRLFKYISPIKRSIKVIAWSIGLTFLFLALLRPQWDKKEETIAQEGRDLFIALDISRSMLAADCQPDRLTCAKNKIKQLIQALSAERVGLILFSGSAFVQCPLTSDYGAFNLYLDQVDVETVSSGSTALDQALQEAMKAFKRLPDRKNKLLAIFTDGEDFSSQLSVVKQQAHAEGIRICTVGVGTLAGAPVPLYDHWGNKIGHQKDEKGNVVISRLNEGILRNLAHDAGGLYVSLSPDDTDIRAIVRYVQGFEKEKLEDTTMSYLQEQYPYFVLASFIFFLIEWTL